MIAGNIDRKLAEDFFGIGLLAILSEIGVKPARF